VGGVPDVVSEAEALLVAPEDPGALADALGALLAEPAAALMRTRAARRRVDTAFGLTPWLERYEAIYRAIRRSPSL
jgi:glycosyltransferase involved in cell wall biosynthesis